MCLTWAEKISPISLRSLYLALHEATASDDVVEKRSMTQPYTAGLNLSFGLRT